MGCLGDVRIEEDEDFAKWGIEIWLSFRDNEPMSRFTDQVQSGGVSGIYLPILRSN